MDFNFKGRDIINGYDFTTQELCHIMDTAMIYEKRVKSGEAIKDMEGMLRHSAHGRQHHRPGQCLRLLPVQG